jgi:hypothetical protein
MRAFSKILAGEPETTLKLELIDRAGKSLTLICGAKRSLQNRAFQLGFWIRASLI